MAVTITIPKGKQVRIRRYSDSAREKRKLGQKLVDINDYDFVLMEAVKFQAASTFTQASQSGGESSGFLQTAVNQIASNSDSALVQNVGGIIGGGSDYLGYQTWSSTNPLELQITIGIISNGNPAEDIIKPLKALMKLCLPRVIKSSGSMRTLAYPGPSITNIIGNSTSLEWGSDVADSNSELTITIGNMVVDHALITSVSPTFMPEVDEEGYPLSVYVELSIKTNRIMTDETVDALFGGFDE